VEVLVLSGCDPLIEDNDKNRAILLVAEDDAVSKQTLKNAMANREKLMSEALEVVALTVPILYIILIYIL